MTRAITVLALPAAAALALAGCDAGGADSAAAPEAALEAADGTDYTACYDGECEVVVSAGTTFDVDPAFGVETLTVAAIEDGVVTVEGEGAGTYVSGTFDAESAAMLNGILIEAAAIDGGEAVLSFTP